MKYKYELHCHTGAVSRCGVIEPERAVECYKEKGYSGMVLTEHYSVLTFLDRHVLTPQKDTDFYLSSYYRALEAAGDDFTVLLGMEIRFYGNGNDYLVYGVTPDFLKSYGNLMSYHPRRFYEICKKHNMVFVQAHPFRPYIYRTNPKYLDGCEIYNAKNNASGINQKAEKWAEKNNMKIRTGGSDLHRETQMDNISGIITEQKITNNDELVAVLRSGNYEIIRQGV